MRAPKTSAAAATQLTSAAFRDGNYMAKLDIENSRAPHLGVGRWSNQQDRASYVAGYQQAYPQALSSERTHDQKDSLRFQLADNESYHSSTGCPSASNQ
jgi:hypothetical protein